MNQKVLKKNTKSSVILPSIISNNKNQQQTKQNALRKKQILVKNTLPPLQQQLNVQSMNELLDKSTDYPLPQQSENLFNLATDINLEAKVLYNKIEISKAQSEAVPVMVSLSAKNVTLGSKLGLDIVCVIDRSCSMIFQSEMIKESLKMLVDSLESKDRLSLIIFNHEVQVLFKLKKMTKEKKIKMKQKIDDIKFTGDINVVDAIEQAFQQLRNRKQENHVAAVFLMTGGQIESSYNQLDQVFSNIDFPYTFHSFGYKENLDDVFLMKLSSLGNGNIYYIPNIQMLNEALFDALGGLMSVVGQQISIMIQCHPKEPFNSICISSTYESKWDAKVEGRYYSVQFPFLSVGQRKDLAFELNLPTLKQLNGKQTAKQNIVTACLAILKIQCPFSKRFYTKICSLKLNLIIGSVANYLTDIDVVVSYFRARIICIIERARLLCKQGYYDQAKNDLNSAIIDLSEYTEFIKKSDWIPFFIEELKQGFEASDQNSYKSYGKLLMMQMVQNNYNQCGITVRCINSESPYADLYQYSESRDVVSQLLFSRQTSCTDDQLN